MRRREAMAYAVGIGGGLGVWKTLDNVVLGYGVITGTNLHRQDLTPLVNEHLRPRSHALPVGAFTAHIENRGQTLRVTSAGETLGQVSLDPTEGSVAELDVSPSSTDGTLAALHADLSAIASGVPVEPMSLQEFFETVPSMDTRPRAIQALRSEAFAGAPLDIVETFTDTDPADPPAIVDGLADGFRQHATYDAPRYAAGAIEDNVLRGAIGLREHLEEDKTMEAMVDGARPGLFCTELTIESIRALHARPAYEQTVPVSACYVSDSRHKHAYTGIVSLARLDGELVMPMTFVDYTFTTLYADLGLDRLLGSEPDAYDTRHRATDIYWHMRL